MEVEWNEPEFPQETHFSTMNGKVHKEKPLQSFWPTNMKQRLLISEIALQSKENIRIID